MEINIKSAVNNNKVSASSHSEKVSGDKRLSFGYVSSGHSDMTLKIDGNRAIVTSTLGTDHIKINEFRNLRQCIAKWTKMSVAYLDYTNGDIVSSQVIWLNRAIKEKILGATDSYKALSQVLGSRECAKNKIVCSVKRLANPVVFHDVNSGTNVLADVLVFITDK